MTILSVGCTRGCFDAQQGGRRDGGSEQSGGSSFHSLLQNTLPRPKCSHSREELAGSGVVLVAPQYAEHGEVMGLSWHWSGWLSPPTAGHHWRTGTAESLWPHPGEGTLNTHAWPQPLPSAGCCGALTQALWSAHPSAGRPRCCCPGCWAPSQGLQQNSRKNTEQRVPGKCIRRAHQEPHLALDSTAQSPRHRRGGNSVTGTIRQHLTLVLPSCVVSCAVAMTPAVTSRTAATPGDQTSKPPLLSRCKGTDSLCMELSTTSMGNVRCSAPSPARHGQLGGLAGLEKHGREIQHL